MTDLVYADYSLMALMPFLTFIGFAFAILLLVACLKRKERKSEEYRKLLADMFVVGKIKQLATEEKINLLEELKEFAKIMKANKIRHEDLDNTIERELQEKISKSGDDLLKHNEAI